MATFFKNFGKGLLYVVAFPFIILAIVLAGVAGLFVFFFQLGKLVYLFFTGRSINSDLEEDIAAKTKLQVMEPQQEEKTSNPQTELSLYPSDSPIYNTSDYVSPTFGEEKEVEAEPIEEEDDNHVI